MKPKFHAFPRHLVLNSTAVMAVFAMSFSAQAQTWDAGAATRNWGTAANWSDDTLPAFDNTTDISYTANVTSPFFNTQMEADRTIRSLTIGGATTTAFGIGGGATVSYNLTLGGAGGAAITIQSGAAGAVTVGNISIGSTLTGIILADNLLITHNGAANLSLNRPVSGTGFGVTKEGTGTAVLSVANTFTGGVTVNGGVLQLSNTNTIAGAINVTNARLNAAANVSTGDDLDSASAINLSGGTLAITHGTFNQNKTYDGAAININTNPSTITWQNTGGGATVLTFSGANAFAVNADLTIDNLHTSTTVNQLITLSRNITGSGDVIVRTNNNISSSASNFTLGRVAFLADNSAWTGDLIVAEGTASIATASAANSSGNSTTGQIFIGETANVHGAGLILGAATGTQTIARNITVRGGGFRSMKGTGDGFYELNGDIALEGTLNMDLAFNAADRRIQVFGDVSGVGGLDFTKSGVGQIFRLAGNNTYQGATTINTGVDLRATNGNGIGNTSAVTFAGAGASLSLETEALPVVETIGSLASADTVGTVNLGDNTLTTGGLNTSTSYGGVITGNVLGGLTKVGSGILTLTGNNTFTGTLTLSGGGLKIISDGPGRAYTGPIVGVGGITVETTNNITATGDDFTTDRLRLAGDNSSWSGNLTIAKGTVSLSGNAVNAAGTGTLTIGTTADSFGAGITFFPNGPEPSTITYPNPIVVTTGGFRGIKGSGFTNHNVTFSGPVTLDGNLTVDHTWGTTERRITLGGIISGNGGLTIARTGGNAGTTAVLSGASTYTGPTTVTTGASLAISGTGSVDSNITVQSGARLGGSGETSGNLTLEDGANFFFFYSLAYVPFDVSGTVTVANPATFGIASLVGGSQGEAVPWASIPAGTYTLIGATASTFGGIQNFGVTNAATSLAGGRSAYFQNGGGTAGGGLQLVVTVAADPFTDWSGGAAFNEDTNNDGVDNGLAWFLGAPDKDANANGLLPETTQSAGALVLEFNCLNATDRGTATFAVQYSSDLGQLDTWAETEVPGVVGTFTAGVVDFEVTDPGEPGGLLKVVASIPVGEAAAGKLFARVVGQP